jgi:hypothetical protein
LCYAANLRDSLLNTEKLQATTTALVKINLVLDRYTQAQSIDIDTGVKVSELREKIMLAFYPLWNPAKLVIKKSGNVLDLTKTLASYGIENESNIEVMINLFGRD